MDEQCSGIEVCREERRASSFCTCSSSIARDISCCHSFTLTRTHAWVRLVPWISSSTLCSSLDARLLLPAYLLSCRLVLRLVAPAIL